MLKLLPITGLDQHFEALYAIYCESISLREQKGKVDLAAMVSKPNYRLLLAMAIAPSSVLASCMWPVANRFVYWNTWRLIKAIAGLSRLAHAQSNPDKITLGTITLSLNNLPIYVAQDKGFYAKENLFVEAVVLNASTRAFPRSLGGQPRYPPPPR
jgi:hypothetical protein